MSLSADALIFTLRAGLPYLPFSADVSGASEEHSVLLWHIGGRAVEGAANVHQSGQGAQCGLQEHSCECLILACVL